MQTDEPLIEHIQALFSPLQPVDSGTTPQRQPLQDIKAVLFDVYGTLLISASGDIGLVAETEGPIALRQLFEKTGLAPLSSSIADLDARSLISDAIKAEHRQARQRGIDVPEVDILAIWTQQLRDLGLELPSARIRRLAIEYEAITNHVWPMPGLAETLTALRDAGLVLGIVSTAQFYTPHILEAFLGQSPSALGFDPACSAWSYQQGVAKPSTTIFAPALEGLARKHGLTATQVLYVGNDMRNDIWPAGRLGMRTALFAGDARSLRLRADDPALRDVRPDRIINALPQLIDLCGLTNTASDSSSL
jgi:putative hydrolase of the HAD superfamily